MIEFILISYRKSPGMRGAEQVGCTTTGEFGFQMGDLTSFERGTEPQRREKMLFSALRCGRKIKHAL